MAQNVMRRAGKAAVATTVAAAVSSMNNDSTIHAEEINDVARVVFCSQSMGQSISQSSRSGFRVSSDPAIHEALVKLGTRIASNPKIQQLVQEEVGDWLLVNSVPGGPSIHSIQEEGKDSYAADESTPEIVRSAFAVELDQLSEDDFRILREAPVIKPISPSLEGEEYVMEEILTPRGVSDTAEPPHRTLIEQVFDWIQDKLSSVVGLFTHHSSNQASAQATPADQSQSQMNPEANVQDENEPGAAFNQSIHSPTFAAAALGIAAVLIVLVTCRRFSPALFKAAIKFIH